MIPLHAIADRQVVARLGVWEIRRYPETDERHVYFASRGFLHLQLWNPSTRTSILTPSRLTGDRFEIARDWTRYAVKRWHEVVDLLRDATLPSGAEIAALHTWMIVRDEVAARRVPAHRAGVAS